MEYINSINDNNYNNEDIMAKKIIPSAVVHRLPRYYRYLGELETRGISKISSKSLAEIMGVTASQIRQDLNCFENFGHQGYGYNVKNLHKKLGEILGVERAFHAVIIGAGNLGQTLANSNLFKKRGIILDALFDINPKIIGLEIRCCKVLDFEIAEDFCRDNKIDIAVLTLPKEATENAAKVLVKSGVRGFWNFSNMELTLVSESNNCDNNSITNCRNNCNNIVVENMHMGDSLMNLCYNLTN